MVCDVRRCGSVRRWRNRWVVRSDVRRRRSVRCRRNRRMVSFEFAKPWQPEVELVLSLRSAKVHRRRAGEFILLSCASVRGDERQRHRSGQHAHGGRHLLLLNVQVQVLVALLDRQACDLSASIPIPTHGLAGLWRESGRIHIPTSYLQRVNFRKERSESRAVFQSAFSLLLLGTCPTVGACAC